MPGTRSAACAAQNAKHEKHYKKLGFPDLDTGKGLRILQQQQRFQLEVLEQDKDLN